MTALEASRRMLEVRLSAVLTIFGCLTVTACEDRFLPVLTPRGDASLIPPQDENRRDAGTLDTGVMVDFESGLCVHIPYEIDGRHLAKSGFVNPCHAPPHTVVIPGAGVIGDGLVSTATTGCQNANNDRILPEMGPYTVTIWVRVDAPAPVGQTLSALRLSNLFDFHVDDVGDLRVILGANRNRRTIGILEDAVADGWHHLALQSDEQTPRTELWLDGRRILDQAQGIGTPTPSNGRTGEFVGALDDFRVYDRRLRDEDIQFLAQP